KTDMDLTRSMQMIYMSSSRERHTRSQRDWSSDVGSSDLPLHPFEDDGVGVPPAGPLRPPHRPQADAAGDRRRPRRAHPRRAGSRSEERSVGKEGRIL